MARIILEEVEEFPVLPDGSIIVVRVESVSEREVQSDRGNWMKLNFTFNIIGLQSIGDGSDVEKYSNAVGTTIWGNCPLRFTTHPDNKLRQWVEAILSMELGPGFELDTDLLVGKQVRAITSSWEKKTGTRQHQVDALLPMKAQASKPVAFQESTSTFEEVPF